MTKTILVVDDSDTVRQQVRRALEPAGYTLVEATDGVEGLASIRSIEGLSLVLCDINMPRMNGLELMAEAQEQCQRIPVLMLTTESQPAIIRRARELGAKGWIVKPFKPEMLAAAVGRLVNEAVNGRGTGGETA